MSRATTAQLHVLRSGIQPLENAPDNGALLNILVSDALVRYWIIERPLGLAGGQDLERYAASKFAAVFGDNPSHWVLRVDPLPQAERWLACAVPAIFAIDLPRAVEQKGWTLRSVQPRFVHEYNRHCREIGPDTAFCVASREGTSIGLITEGSWRSIRVHPPLGDSTADFSTLLRRDCCRAGVDLERLQRVVVGSLRDAAR